MKRGTVMAVILCFSLFMTGCDSLFQPAGKNECIIFYAPAFAPVIDAIRESISEDCNLVLRTESNGSQILCRKVVELGRVCDLMMISDHNLFESICRNYFNWHIDFISDEIVLGVGIRAPHTDQAEKDWLPVLLENDVTLGRVNENLGPIGYRTLLVWRLMEMNGKPRVLNTLKKKASVITEDVGQLATLLKSGDVDYGFLYKTVCIKYDIRFISLDPSINLGVGGHDYERARVVFENISGSGEEVVAKGEQITYGFSIPVTAPNPDCGRSVIRHIIQKDKEAFEMRGFTMITPRFYGSPEDFQQFKDIAEYAGTRHEK